MPNQLAHLSWPIRTAAPQSRNLFYDYLMQAGFQCAGCGEWNETQVDSSAGSRQSYVEDCQVCCKPNLLCVIWDGSAREYTITAELE